MKSEMYEELQDRREARRARRIIVALVLVLIIGIAVCWYLGIPLIG